MTDGRKNPTSPTIRCSDEDKKSFKAGGKDTYKFTLPNALDGKVTTVSSDLWSFIGLESRIIKKMVYVIRKRVFFYVTTYCL